MIPNKEAWSGVGCICFDVDSTVCTDEGLDELARFLKCEDRIELITKQAMNGELDFRQALTSRLALMKPTKDDISRYLSSKKPSLTEGIDTIVEKLKSNGIEVYLVSGGFDLLVNPVAASLNLPQENVYSNKLLFADDGSYAGFDTGALTSKSEGKALVVAELIERLHTKVVIVGDGMTDARACPPATHFVGFGVNVDRPSVRDSTPYFCTSVDQLEQLFQSVGLIRD
ncbi:unnamed protein product [Fasciola hepatica]|uniref:Phosphoserine phosphatase n=2 Tax=Fasciola hepatica TaxID=6192 RepID=A0ABC9HHB9_FASHE|nr:unnamed protein product [Fasciola hepatica]